MYHEPELSQPPCQLGASALAAHALRLATAAQPVPWCMVPALRALLVARARVLSFPPPCHGVMEAFHALLTAQA